MSPVKGWGSIATENGYVIIEPLSARPRYRVVYPEGVIVRSAADIDDSDFVRVIAKGETVEGTGQVQMFDNVERIQVRLFLLSLSLCPPLGNRVSSCVGGVCQDVGDSGSFMIIAGFAHGPVAAGQSFDPRWIITRAANTERICISR